MERPDQQLYDFMVGAPALPITRNVSVSLNTRLKPEHFDAFGDVATFSVRTGACDVQTYLTAEACRAIAAALIAAAEAVDARVHPVLQEAA